MYNYSKNFAFQFFQIEKCIKENVLHLPVNYRTNRKAWMISDTFIEFVRSINFKSKSKSRGTSYIDVLEKCRIVFPSTQHNI